VELMYNAQFDIKYTLSINQINNHIYNYFSGTEDMCNGTTGNDGGHQICALKYIAGQGITTEFVYSFWREYRLQNNMPVAVSDIRYPCHGNATAHLACMRELLSHSAIMGTIVGTSHYIERDFVVNGSKSHAILITDLCQASDGVYVEYQNSWGPSWGQCGGFGYIRVVDEQGNLYDNRGILHDLLVANVSDLRHGMSFFDASQWEHLFTISYMGLGVFMCVVLLCVLVLVIQIRHVFSHRRHTGDSGPGSSELATV